MPAPQRGLTLIGIYEKALPKVGGFNSIYWSIKRSGKVQLLTRKFTVEQYHKMADVGILTEQDRVELVEGEIIQMSPIGIKHAASVNRLNKLFNNKLRDKVLVSIQNPIELNKTSEPQPDVALLRYKDDFYETNIPRSEDICLIVEVADTTITYDRGIKIPLYSQNNIIETWLIDLNSTYLEVYRHPTPEGYKSMQKLKAEENISLLAFPEISFNVPEILGK